ncbi:MAG: Glu/Leu/Phe/Val dehydrogenase, partial [Patescibacteria group bacterium]
DLPLGGGKGGVTVNPKELSQVELEGLTRSFTRSIGDVIGPDKDVPAPDVNTTPQIMDWLVDEYSNIVGHPSPAVVTGKSLEHGGSEGRGAATGKGAYLVFEAFRSEHNLQPGATVAVQGFGNAGQEIARLFHENGYKVIAVSDSHGGIFNEGGLDLPALIRHKKETKSVLGFAGSHEISDSKLLALMCDILVPAFMENQITGENAESLNCKVVLEVANGPTSPEADEILARRRIKLFPDVLTNAGGVVVSCFEWMQNKQGEHWSEEQVFDRLKQTMDKASTSVIQTAKQHNIIYRQAAFIVALERLSKK